MRCLCLPVIAAAVAAVFLPGCSRSGISATASYNPGYGPFDKDGNYVEAWADKPAKKHWWSRKPANTKPARPTAPAATKKDPPLVASNTRRSSSSTRKPSKAPGSPFASLNRTRLVSRPPAAKPPAPLPVSRPPASRPLPTPPLVVSRPQPTPPPVITRSERSPLPVATTPPPRAQPKPVRVTPKRPAPLRHVVRKGDTLFGLSRRYGTSVRAIQRANGIRGSTIRVGQGLRIPR